ncbi:amino acid ABC transporter permease [Azohydromonas aeria]|uniref:amino acid ABC transporter permease n=1 Tax=Azohydromonas aeria TaxID=2590212 RepID=UPI0012FBE597|nr:amino acid ABC transporter permease [Azohydromonas aeria]
MLRYEFDWGLLLQPQFLELVRDGLVRTLALALASGLLSFVLGAVLALARLSAVAPLRITANGLAELVRNLPGLFWILFFYFVLPELLPAPIGRALHEWPTYAFVAGVLGLSLDNGAYLSDILRNGMARISQGQRDAAASCGMSRWQECIWILCPQSLRTMMPAISNRMVHNFKNTSLCVAIALPELTWATQQIESITFRGLEVTAVSTLTYALGSLAIAFALSRIFRQRGAVSPDHIEEACHGRR